MKLTYDDVVSICDAHGICLPVECVETVVSIVEHIQPDHSGDGGETRAALRLCVNELRAWMKDHGQDIRSQEAVKRANALLDGEVSPAAPVPKDGGDERISTKALREHASKGWDDNCLLPKGSVKRIADELDALRAALAQKAVPMSAPAESSVPVNFLGIDPLEISRGAHLPMIPESWRYGFRKTANGYDFSFQDDGPLVAWDAVKDIVAQKAVPIAGTAVASALNLVFFDTWWKANQESAPFQNLHREAAREIWIAATEIANGGS